MEKHYETVRQLGHISGTGDGVVAGLLIRTFFLWRSDRTVRGGGDGPIAMLDSHGFGVDAQSQHVKELRDRVHESSNVIRRALRIEKGLHSGGKLLSSELIAMRIQCRGA